MRVPVRLTLRAVGACLASLLCGSASTQAQTIRTDLWTTNGTVRTAVVSNNRLYIGGDFTYVGPETGSTVQIDPVTGQPVPPAPFTNGSIATMIPDGAGGWYVGGSFSSILGVPKANLAHLLADHTVAAWDPNPNSAVYFLARIGSTIFAYGGFTSIGGQSRNTMGAVDAVTGIATAWAPAPANNTVQAFAASANWVYIGGGFSSVGGQPRNYVAQLDPITGNATNWNPNPAGGVFPWVNGLATSGSTVYVSGGFTGPWR